MWPRATLTRVEWLRVGALLLLTTFPISAALFTLAICYWHEWVRDIWLVFGIVFLYIACQTAITLWRRRER